MKRAVGVLVLLLVVAYQVKADYLLIKIDVSKVPFNELATKQFVPPSGGPGGNKGGAGKGFPMGQPMQPFNPMGKAGGKVGGAAGGAGNDEPGQWLYGAIEFSSKKPPQFLPSASNPFVISFDHRWGKSAYIPLPLDDYVKLQQLQKDSVLEDFRAKRKKDWGDGKNGDNMYRLASWALAHGLIKEFHSTMAELKKIDPKRAAVVNYDRLQAALKKPPTGEDPVQASVLAQLRSQGFRDAKGDDSHYVIFYKDGADVAETLKRRKQRLEESFNNFFYWFALQEKIDQPPLPPYRLPVVVETPGDFLKRQKEAGLGQSHTDAFTIRRDNLMVLTAKPVDEEYLSLERTLQPVRQNMSLLQDELVTGAVWRRPEAQRVMTGVAYVQLLTVLQRFKEDESEQSGISRESVRQLLGATGMLSRNISAPEWVQFGMTSFFETPAGSLYPNFGLPSTSNLVAFKKLRKAGKLGKSSEVLLNLATDHYFRQARLDENTLREMEKGDTKKRDLDKQHAKVKESEDLARCTSWALVYYLALHHKSGHLRRYLHELNELPRNLELSPQALQTCFARAFNVADPANPQKLDPGRLQTLAESWFQEMLNTSLEQSELEAFHNEAQPAAAAGTKK